MKIITRLRDRRQIEADLRRMLSVTADQEFQQRAQQIAASGPEVIPAILGHLDQADTQMLEAIGTVATYLDRTQVAAALHEAGRQPGRTVRGRSAAMTLLERFLGEAAVGEPVSTPPDLAAEAVSALPGLLAQSEENPAVLVEFVQRLDRQEPDVALAVIRALRHSQHPQAVELLRMTAQDVRAEIATEGLQCLGALRHAPAARALQTLIPVVAPELRPPAERLLRKLQFSGVKVETLPPPKAGWRALVGPIDGTGQQTVWFVQGSRWGDRARLLRVWLSDRFGAVQAVGHSQVPAQLLPPARPVGYVHDLDLLGGPSTLLLEGSFDLGRRLVADALAHNRETQIPVAGPLRFMSGWLWGYAIATPLPPPTLPELEEGDVDGLIGSEQLLRHPACTGWLAQDQAILQAAAEAARRPGWNLEAWTGRLTGELYAEPKSVQLVGQRLIALSEWLLLAGDGMHSRKALAIARSILQARPQDHPFLQGMVRRGLSLAVNSLDPGADPDLESK